MTEQPTVEQLSATADALTASIEQDVRDLTETISRLLVAEAADAGGGKPPADPAVLVALALRESFERASEDLAHYAKKVTLYNDVKKAVRDLLSALKTLEQDNEAKLTGPGSVAPQAAAPPLAALSTDIRLRRRQGDAGR